MLASLALVSYMQRIFLSIHLGVLPPSNTKQLAKRYWYIVCNNSTTYTIEANV